MNVKALLHKQPVAIAAALRAVLYALVLMGVVELTEEQLAGLAIALEAVLGLFVWNAVTPTADPSLEVGAEVNVMHSDGETVVINPTGPAAG